MIAQIYSDDFEIIQQHNISPYQRDLMRFPIVWSFDGSGLLSIQHDESNNPALLFIPLDSELDEMYIPLPENIHQVYWSSDKQYIAYQTTQERSSTVPLIEYVLHLLHIPTATSSLLRKQVTRDALLGLTGAILSRILKTAATMKIIPFS